MKAENLKIYCVTNKKVNFISKKVYHLAWAGNQKAPSDYLNCESGENINHKEKYYSELAFHYWYWRNLLKSENPDNWIGFCQKRRFWITKEMQENINQQNINEYLITEPSKDWSKYDSIICKPINVSGAKKIKIIKRGWKNLIKDPLI